MRAEEFAVGQIDPAAHYDTEIATITDPGDEAILRAGKIIREGGMVVFPTETVYGLGGSALRSDAAEKIYRAKGRPSDNPLIVHLAEAGQADAYCETTPLYDTLAAIFSPGPLTMIMKKKDTIPSTVTGGMDTVAIRIPSDSVANALICAAGVPIAAPSANISGHPSPTTAAHVIHDLCGRVDMILAGEDSAIGLESTVIKLDGDHVTLLRPGAVTYEDLCDVLGAENVTIDRIVTDKVTGTIKPLSPGMKYKHYAPKAQVILLDGTPQAVLEQMKSRKNTPNMGILCYDEDVPELRGEHTLTLGKREDSMTQAHRLFGCLRAFDEMDVNAILAPLPDKHGIGLAVYNRIIKAAGFDVEKV